MSIETELVPTEFEESEIVISPSQSLSALELAALWNHRELYYFLAWRDIKVRYKQTVLGAD